MQHAFIQKISTQGLAFLFVGSSTLLSSCQAQETGAQVPITNLQPLPALTPADMRGPDGLIYPNFSFAGVPGGIPKVAVRARLEEFGGKPGGDIADALEKGAAEVAKRGGGALLIGAGNYFLDRPIAVSGSGVVLRGAGRDQTKITFRWQPEEASIDFIGLKDGDTISPNRPIFVAAWNPSKNNVVEKAIKRIAFEINGKPGGEQNGGEGPWFAVSNDYRKTALLFQDGPNTLRATVEYLDGRTAEKTISVIADKNAPHLAAGPTDSAITFNDPTNGAVTWGNGDVARLPKRGDTSLEFQKPQPFKTGDLVRVLWPAGSWHSNPMLLVNSVEGNTLHFSTSIRFDMDKVLSVRSLKTIRGSGVEDLTLEQTSQHWTNLLAFSNDVGCWVRGTRLKNAGRFPIAGGTKHFEVRDTIADGAQFHFGVGGGTGYFGFSTSQDSLMDNVQTFKLRHAPNLQTGAQGCVIRNSLFEDSDMQFHREQTYDNLLENNVIRSRGSNKFYGSYGSALTATTSPKTGEMGARNVIWNNDFESLTVYKGGSAVSFTGGAMKGWTIAYNRFDHDIGFAINSDGEGHDVLFLKNHFAVKAPDATALTGNVSALRLRDNHFSGWSEAQMTKAGASALEAKGNTFSPTYQSPERPSPPVASLFDWQKAKAQNSE